MPDFNFTFPSGKSFTVSLDGTPKELLARQTENRPKANNALKHACAHITEPIDIKAGCAGKRDSVWGCELHGQCKPLAAIRTAFGPRPCRYCADYEPSPDPSLTQELYSVGEAANKWIDAGRPTRDDKRIAEITAICKACPLIRNGKVGQWCGACGCYLKPKIRMSTESCPKGLWAAEA